MRQLNEEERSLIQKITEECETPADLTTKLKELFSGALEMMLETYDIENRVLAMYSQGIEVLSKAVAAARKVEAVAKYYEYMRSMFGVTE